LLGLAELEKTGFLGDNCALVFWGQAGYKFGHKFADLLRIQITHFFGNIDNGSDDFLVAFLFSLFEGAPSSTDLYGKLLTASVSNKLAWLFLHILGCAGRLIHSLADLLALTIAHLLHGPVALVHFVFISLLFECDRTRLLKCFITNFFLRRFELSNISVVALLSILVGALQDGLLLQGSHCLLLVHAAQSSIWICDTAAEVNASRDSGILLSASSGKLRMTKSVGSASPEKSSNHKNLKQSLL